MRVSFCGLPFSRILRQFEEGMETVIRVLLPGPLERVEHKFSAEEIRQATATVRTAVENWRRHAREHKPDVLKHFIHN